MRWGKLTPRLAGAMCTIARAVLKLIIAGCFGLFMYVAWGWILDSYDVQLERLLSSMGMRYPYAAAAGLKVESLDASDTLMVALQWLPVLVSALAAMLLLVIPRGAVPRGYRRLRRQISRLLAWEAPPRRFWTWWCGGMSVKDMVVLGFVLALNLWYFIHYYTRYKARLDAVAASGLAFPEPRWQLMLERVAITFGIMMWPCLWLLFFPIPQSSFLQQLSGLQYSEMMRYHRWIGHITLVVLSLHGWLYYLYWAVSREFWVNFSNWSTLHSINNLAGSLSYFCALVLWTTSIKWVRTRLFEVFYRCHIVCFLGFMLFGYMHYYWSWSYFLPGLLLYAVDITLRTGQLSNTTLVTAATVDNEAGVATLQFKTSEACSACPMHELFLLVPSISRWQWHPFSVAGTAPDPDSRGSIVTLSIKRYGRWTKALMERLQSAQPVAVRVAALEVPKHMAWEGCQAVVLLGGGIGATPLLAMLRSMVARRKSDPSAAKSQPARVHFVWASRQPREFCILDGELLEAARSSDGWLTIELYSTKPAAKAPSKQSSMDSAMTVDSLDSLEKKHSGEASLDGFNSSTPLMNEGNAAVLSSPFLHKCAMVIHPRTVGLCHLALVYLLVWLGAFLGTYLGGAYWAEALTHYASTGSRRPTTLNWKVGMVWYFAQIIMALGLPYLLAVLPVNIWRYWRATRTPDSKLVLPVAPPGPTTGHGSGCRLVGGMLSACGEAGLEVLSGRPDLRGAMLAAAKGVAAGDTVGVFVGGPEPLTRQVQLLTSELNSWGNRPSPFFAFRALAHSL